MDSERTMASKEVTQLLDRLRGGDSTAKDALIQAAHNRLLVMVRRMKESFRNVARWEQTEDVHQNALLRLHRSLSEVRPEDTRHFYRLAALQIRRELLDLARHYAKRGEQHQTRPRTEDGVSPPFDPAGITDDPQTMAQWAEFHKTIESLGEAEREVVELLWYHGLNQPEVAELLNVDVRTVKRRWRRARLELHDRLHGEPPNW